MTSARAPLDTSDAEALYTALVLIDQSLRTAVARLLRLRGLLASVRRGLGAGREPTADAEWLSEEPSVPFDQPRPARSPLPPSLREFLGHGRHTGR
ncbi:MAG: hypothetical protein K6T28_02585 [Acidothermus sp.]|nr:hypothetical protein [Acidothermus sp.]